MPTEARDVWRLGPFRFPWVQFRPPRSASYRRVPSASAVSGARFPMAMDEEELVDWCGPTLQRYLTGPAPE